MLLGGYGDCILQMATDEEMNIAKLESNRLGREQPWVLDLTTWDFSKEDCRRKPLRKIAEDKPRLLIGSPMSGPLSSRQRVNENTNRDEGSTFTSGSVRNGLTRDAIEHLTFCCKLYRLQASMGNYFLHEHSAWAPNWKMPCMRKMTTIPGVMCVISDMCSFGMFQVDGNGPALIKKGMRFMSNAPEVLKVLGVKCSGDHRHLMKSRADSGGIYLLPSAHPRALCQAICRGLKK